MNLLLTVAVLVIAVFLLIKFFKSVEINKSGLSLIMLSKRVIALCF